MKTTEVDNCQFSKWYRLFRHFTITSKVIKLPDTFLEYLHADGIVLPASCEAPTVSKPTPEDENSDSNAEAWSSSDSSETQVPDFSEFESKIKNAIQRLDGAVFPKLNWSSPKDATWISCGNTLQCNSPADIYLLLKSSDFITHDLTEPYDNCDEQTESAMAAAMPEYTLVLRRWTQIHPAGEFRCFVYKKQLIGICQRHNSSHYDFIKNDQEGIVEDIKQLFNSVVKEKFPSDSYIFDVYRKEKGKVILIDFNPFHRVTDGLLFDWEELNNWNLDANSSKEPEFRFVETQAGVQPNPYSCYTMPVDFVHLSTGEDPNKLMDFLNLKIQSQKEESESSDEEETTRNSLTEQSNTDNG